MEKRFHFSQSFVILDWGLELEGFIGIMEGHGIQFCVQVLLETCRLCECAGMHTHYKQGLAIAQGSRQNGGLPPSEDGYVLTFGDTRGDLLRRQYPMVERFLTHRTEEIRTAKRVWETNKTEASS